jgi:MoaA/NifB/PqqE/SkfB family radical SAM enzyme
MERPTLADGWDLVIEDGCALVRRQSEGAVVAALTGAEAVILGLMDGRRSLDELKEVVRAALGTPVLSLLGRLMRRLEPLLADGVPRSWACGLEELAASRPERRRLRPLPGPRVLHWWVTSSCPRRCVYCFAEPTLLGSAPDAVLPRSRLREILQEARSLGAETLLVAGAEPFLRPDLPEVMGDAVSCGITPSVTTKHPINNQLAERLAIAGVRHISLSVDSLDPSVNGPLIGSRTYGDQVRRSVAALRAAGVAHSFQCVVTRDNPHGFVEVAELAAQSGARVVQVVPFEDILHPIAHLANADMRAPSHAAIEAEVAELDDRLDGVRVEMFEEIGADGRGAGLECDVGITKLFFLPNGVVHRCYKLVKDRRLDGPDLRSISVAHAWHDEEYAEIISPPAAAYAGTACSGCNRFGTCHSEGRCIYRSYVNWGTYTGPDRACDRSALFRQPVT